MSDRGVQVLAVDDIAFLEAHDATLHFSAGKKIGVDWRRPDGLVVQHSGWTVGEALNAARAALRKWNNSEEMAGSPAGGTE